jgi:flagellin
MALTVATNTGALMAQAAASSVNKEMEMSMERLSTGKRINGASDDAAGVAIASRLTAEIKGTNQAIRNAMDGQALIDTAEGAHQEVENILQRMRELAVQASNGTNDTSDRANLQTEMDALINEIDRIASVTTWAGQDLLNGGGSASKSFNLQIGAGTSANVDNIGVTIKTLATTGATMKNAAGSASINGLLSTSSGTSLPALAITMFKADGTAASSAEFTITNTAAANGEIIVDDHASNTDDVRVVKIAVGAGAAQYNLTIDVASNATKENIANAIAQEITRADSSITADTSAANAGKIVLTQTGSTSGGGLSSEANARNAIDTIDNAIKNLNNQRAQLGSYSNRLDSTVSNLTNISANLEAGRGRIEDADFAAETTSLAKSQILQQASTAMLAQANASKQNVLSLLQG